VFDSEGDSFSSVGSPPPGAHTLALGGVGAVSVDDSYSSEDSFATPADRRKSVLQSTVAMGVVGGEREEETVFGVSRENGGLGRPGQRRVTGFELVGTRMT